MCAQRGRQPTADVKTEKEISSREDSEVLTQSAKQKSPRASSPFRNSNDRLGDSFQTARSELNASRTASQPLLEKMIDTNNSEDEEITINGKKINTVEFRNSDSQLDIDSLKENHLDLREDNRKSVHSDGIALPLVAPQLSTSSSRAAPWLTAEELEKYASTEKHKKARKYYRRQIDLVKNYRDDSEFVQRFAEDEDNIRKEQRRELVKRSDDILSKISLVANICLLAAKCAAAGLSGSLVVIGSVVDSATDITAGLVIYLTNRAILKRDIYDYPRGRTRLQPIALVIISVIMGACSVQVISKSLESIGRWAAGAKGDVDVEVPTIVIMVSTIVLKFTLMVVCYLYRSPATVVLAQDHRNDTISNTVAIVCAYLASKYWIFLDPIAAIIVSLYILITWLRTGNEHVKVLSGKAAKPDFINRIVKICLDHRPALKQLDTVYAYHYGTKYLVEIDVVLDETLSVKEAHDIAEPLQRKIEYLQDVERAFVHIDYETDHRPDYEHKVV